MYKVILIGDVHNTLCCLLHTLNTHGDVDREEVWGGAETGSAANQAGSRGGEGRVHYRIPA